MRFILFVQILFTSNLLCAQMIHPSNDPTWNLEWSEDFNNLNNWSVFDELDARYINCDSTNINSVNEEKLVYIDNSQNVDVNNGVLNITIKENNYHCTSSVHQWGCSYQNCQEQQNGNYSYNYEYTSGIVESNKEDFNFGYIEAKVRIPTGYGLNTAFFTLSRSYTTSPEKDIYEEIDVFEAINGAYHQGTSYTDDNISNNYHVTQPGGDVLNGIYQVSHDYDDGNFHLYAIHWTPSKLEYYIDGNLVREVTNHNLYLEHVLKFQIGYHTWVNWADRSQYFPQTMEVDWVKYYKINSNCSNLTTCNLNFATYVPEVRNEIVIGGSGCQNTVPSGNSYYFTAENGITLSGEFTCTGGAELILDTKECY